MNNENNTVSNNDTESALQPLESIIDEQKEIQSTVDAIATNESQAQTSTNAENQTNTNTVNEEANVQNELKSIPTIDQNKDQFMNNVQNMNPEKKEEKKDGVNMIFVIIMFVIILVAILFLFPLLLDYI